MKRDKGFSMETVRRDDFHGGRNEYRISDKFSDEDIERAWRKAYEKVGEFVMPEERE